MTGNPESVLTTLPVEVLLRHCAVPLRLEDGTLTVALAEDAASEAALEDLRFVSPQPIAVERAPRAEILAALLRHPHLKPAVSDCDPRLSFACPRSWAALQQTDDPLVRRCRVCSKDVRFFTDAVAAQQANPQGAAHCVALPGPGGLVLGNLDPDLLGAGLMEDEPAEPSPEEDVDAAAWALIAALESQDPEAATGDLIEHSYDED